MNATLPLTSFTGGEWSPRLMGRVDIAKYNSACEILQNMIIYPHGGVTRRMGMEYIDDSKTESVRLIPFEYNREQAYILEFGNSYIRFFRDGGQVQSGGVPLEVAAPWEVGEIWDISFCQSNDVLYLAHKNHPPMKLARTGPDTFSLSPIAFTSRPAAWTDTLNPGGLPRSKINDPAVVTLFQSRLVFAGTPEQPQKIWMSKVSDLENFTQGAGSSDSLEFTLSSTQNNAIQWIVPGKNLQIGTTGGEFTLEMPDNSALSVSVKRHSNFGSAFGRTQLVGTGTIYISRDKKKVREMSYSFEADGFISPELSLLSEHLTRDTTIKDFDFAQSPDGILWLVMEDGSFCGFTYLKSQDVQGWHRHTTQGNVLSVCTVEGSEGSETWFAVNRNGATRIERFAPAFSGSSPDDLKCAYLDSYLTYEGAPVDTLSGLDHLEGLTVRVLADGYYLTDKEVVGGSITLERESSRVIVGLPYEWRVVPLRLEGGSPTGFSQGKKKSIESLVLRLERSAGIYYKIFGEDKPFTSLINTREYGQNYGTPIVLETGDEKIKLPPSWDRRGQFELKGDSPFPVTLLMVAATVKVNE